MKQQWVVVHHCNYDGLDVHGPFESEDEADRSAFSHGGRSRRVVPAGVFALERKFVAIEACALGGITVYGWFPSLTAAEAFCHRQGAMSSPGVQFTAVAVP